MNIQEIRKQYPEYADLSDEQLAQGLHQKFYGDMPYEQFAEQIGLARQPSSAGAMQRPQEFAWGFNKGLAHTLGLPVDLMNWGLNKVGVGSEMPVAGSDWFLDKLQQAGAIGEPTDTTGRVLSRIGQEIGATALPVGATLGAANTTRRFASPLVNDIVQSVRAAPGTYAAAEAGLSTASGAGAATAREMFPGNPYAEMAGQWLPLLAPTAAAGLARTVMRGGEAGQKTLQKNLETFARAGVEPTVGQATGGTYTQGIENVLAKTPGGVTPMHRAAQRAADQLSGKVDDLASGLSRHTETEAAGRAIERGVADFANRFRAQSDKLYGRLDMFIPGNASVKVANTQNALETMTAPIQGAENLSGILANPKLAKIHEALAADAGTTGTLPYRALKEIRSQVGRMLSSPDVISDAPRAQLKTLYGALTRDMETAAAAAGPGAERALSRANKYYRSGMERIDNVLESVVKRGKPEEVFQAAMRGASEGATTIRSLRRSVPAEQWDVVAATVLQRMGLARKGMQNAAGDAFSVETYLTNWNKLKPEARSALFGGTRYATLSKDLDAIAESASKIREASRILANPSGTAGQASHINTLLGTGAGVGAPMLAGRPDIAGSVAMTVGAVMGTANAGARLLTNQKFVRWLAESTRLPAERLPGHIARLSVTMRREDQDTKEAVRTYLQQLGGNNNE